MSGRKGCLADNREEEEEGGYHEIISLRQGIPAIEITFTKQSVSFFFQTWRVLFYEKSIIMLMCGFLYVCNIYMIFFFYALRFQIA